MKCVTSIIAIAMLMFASAWTAVSDGAEPLPAAASQSADDSPSELTYTPQWPEPPNTGAMLMRLGLGTIGVLALCVVTLVVGKPWLQKLQSKGTGSQTFQIEGTITLGSRAALYLVKVGDTKLVVGTDASGLKSLIPLPASFREVLDDQLPQDDLSPVARQQFGTLSTVAGSKE